MTRRPRAVRARLLGGLLYLIAQDEDLTDWGITIHQALHAKAWASPEARAVALTLAKALATAQAAFVDAVLEVERLKARATFAQARLEQACEDFDAESGKVIRFLRASLELAGEDYLSRRVLGKRRGRPRKSKTARRESDVEATESSAVARKIDSATVSEPSTARKFDEAPSSGASAKDGRPA